MTVETTEDRRATVTELWKAMIDKAIDLDVIIEGEINVLFPSGFVVPMKIRKSAQ